MPPWLGRAGVPKQHFCSSPPQLWYKGFAEHPYNTSNSHRHLATQAVLQTLIETRGTGIFFPSLVYTALSLASVSQTRQVHWSNPDVAPGHPTLGWDVNPTSLVLIMTVLGQMSKEPYHQAFSQSPLTTARWKPVWTSISGNPNAQTEGTKAMGDSSESPFAG